MEENKKLIMESKRWEKFFPIFQGIKERSKFLSRKGEKGIVNPSSGSSLSMRDDGTMNMVSGKKAQYKLKRGQASEISLKSETITVKKELSADEIIINNRKLNPQLYEMTDLKEVLGNEDSIVGGMTMFTTVLVKAWEPTLGKYVLIRRLARTPMFSTTLNTPPIHEGMSISEEEVIKELEKIDEAIIGEDS